MGLEVPTYISDLASTNPTSSDPKNEGDDHIRNLKVAIKASFPNVTGAVTATQAELNIVTGLLNRVYPVGAIYMSAANTSPQSLFGGTWAAIRTGRVLISESATYAAGSTGGSKDAVAVNHGHTATSNTTGSHTHAQVLSGGGVDAAGPRVSGSNTLSSVRNAIDPTQAAGNHFHTITVNSLTGEAGTDKNMQPYLAVYMWQRTA